MTERLKTVQEAAETLRLTGRRLRQLAHSGRIAHVSVGRNLYFTDDGMNAFILSHTKQAAQCQDETLAQGLNSLRNEMATISVGPKAVAAASAAHLQQIAERLKKPLQILSSDEHRQHARVIPMKR